MAVTTPTAKRLDVCEVVPSAFPINIPGPLIGLTVWYLHFLVTRGGKSDSPVMADVEAGEIGHDEMERAAADGWSVLEETDRRRECLDRLTKQMQKEGWELFETGNDWFSRRFRRQ